MPTYPANAPEPSIERPSVVFVIYPGIVLLDLVGPLHVFTQASADGSDEKFFQTHIVSVTGEPVETNTLVKIDTRPIEEFLEASEGSTIDTLVVVGGNGAEASRQQSSLSQKVSELVERSGRVCSVCCGAFILAEAGALDGRRAVTHWEDCELLSERYPAINVEVDPIFIKDGHVWTSAGITAGIDMALAVVREDLGPAEALRLARSLVTPMIRQSGQSQFSAELARQTNDTRGEFSILHDWLRANLALPIAVSDMAEKCAMSARSFSRRYAASVGLTPANSLELMRVDYARSLLIETNMSMKAIAVQCGFGDHEKLRRAFHRHLNTSPSNYQATFRT